MVNYLSLVNHQGRLFITPPVNEQDGLLCVIDLKDKNKMFNPLDIRFNSQGDAFLVTDTRGQVTMFQVQANRYLVIHQSTKTHSVNFACFTGRQPTDQVFIAFKDKSIQTHSLNGKLLDKFTGAHNTEIRGLESNQVKMIATVSNDACVLWSSVGANSVSKQRSIYSKDGNHFNQVRFSADGQAMVTLFKDGDILQWGLDGQQQIDATLAQLSFKSQQITCFEVGSLNLLASGSNLPYLIVKSLKTQQQFYYRLPTGCRGIEKMTMLRDQNLVAFLSEGFFYLIDISYATNLEKQDQKSRPVVKLNIRIPHEQIQTYDIDIQMSSVVLGTNSGNVYIYELPKAFENERIIAKRKLDLGVEEDLVYTYLDRVHVNEFNDYLQNQSTFPMGSIISQTLKDPIIPQAVVSASSSFQLDQQPTIGQGNMFTTGALAQSHADLMIENHTGSTQRLHQHNKSIVSVGQNNNRPIVSSINSSTIGGGYVQSEKQEYLNAGLSTALAGKPKQSLPSHQVSIMKTINSQNQSVIRNNIKQSQMQSQMSTMRQQQQPGLISTMTQNNQDGLYTIDETFEADYNFTASTVQAPQFNMTKLRQMLKQFGEYPEKYRFLTWKHLLSLPCNKEAFNGLLRKGVHPAFKALHKRFPINSHRLYNKLVRTLSALGNWCPVFSADNVEHLPQMVFPFIKCIQNDDLLVFELILALIVQYQQVWYEGYPAEPLVVLTAVEQILEKEDSKLLSHLRSNAFTPQIYAWPILKSLFTEVLSKDDWLRLMDHLFTYRDDPEFLLFYCAAFLIQSRNTILGQVFTIDDMYAFQSKMTQIPFKKISQQAHQLHSKHHQSIFCGTIQNALPMPAQGDYPIFNRYPEQVAISQIKIREKIISEEEELQRKHQLLEELRIKTEQVLANEERIRKQQEAAALAEIERKRKLQQEQEQMLQERIRLEEMTRLAKLEHIKKIEDALEQALTRQENLKLHEAKIAEEEFEQRQRAAKYEYESRLQDENIANMEFKANQKLLEMLQKQQSEEAIRKMKTEFEARQREEEHRDRLTQERWRMEDQEQRLKSELIRQTLQQQSQQMLQLAERAKIEQKIREQELEKEISLFKIEEQRRLRQLEEEQVLRKQRFMEDMRNRTEQEFQIEQERLWRQMQEEKDRERAYAAQRLRALEDERRQIELELEREKLEREHIQRLEMQKREESQVLAQYRAEQESILHRERQERDRIEAGQAERIRQMERQAQCDREMEMQQKMQREAVEQRKSLERDNKVKESDNLMNMLRQKEQEINVIVDRGQRELQERKNSRVSSDPSARENYGYQRPSQAPIQVYNQNDYNQKQVPTNVQPYQPQPTAHYLPQQQMYYPQEKENLSQNLNYSYPLRPGHHQANMSSLYSRTLGEADSSKSPSSQSQSRQSEEESSLSETSSYNDKNYDSMLIEKHRQVKQEFEDYKQSFGNAKVTNVFAYGGDQHNPILQAQTINSQPNHQVYDAYHHTLGNTNVLQQNKAHLRQNDTGSYLSSSSSSDDESDTYHQNYTQQRPEGIQSSYTSSPESHIKNDHRGQQLVATDMLDMSQSPQQIIPGVITTTNGLNQSSFSSSSQSSAHQMSLSYQRATELPFNNSKSINNGSVY